MIRKDTDYAMRMLGHLAENESHDFVSVKTIAKEQDVPVDYAYKIIRKLNAAKITKSQVGAQGGVMLNKELKYITLRDVIEAIQGPIYISECVLNSGICSKNPVCKFSPRWAVIQHELVSMLDKTTLADILN
jgi:Rrf2 family protein